MSLTRGTAERRGARGAGRAPCHAAHGRCGPAGPRGTGTGEGLRGTAAASRAPVSQVGTNLTDLRLPQKVTVRELGGCMGPIWPSYYSECSALLVSSAGSASWGRGERGFWGWGPPVSSVLPRGGISLLRALLWPGVALGTLAPPFPFFPLVRGGCLQPYSGLLVLHAAALCPLCRAARRRARPGPLQQDVRRRVSRREGVPGSSGCALLHFPGWRPLRGALVVG